MQFAQADKCTDEGINW